jgi:glycosyltransferase involved in cell wall biosynthesis
VPGSALVLVENLSVPFDRRVTQEARSLRQHGWEVDVICPEGPDRGARDDVDGVRVHRYPLRAAGGRGGPLGWVREYAVALWRTARLARRVQRRGPIDVVHLCNPPDLLFLVALWLRLRGTRVVFDHHDLSPELYLSRFGRGRDLVHRALLAAEWLTFRTADVVLSTNESYAAVARGRGRVDPDRVFVVRTAPDPDRFAPVPPQRALRRGAQHLICYLGVMGPQDGVDLAVRALARLAAQRDDWCAVLVGDGDARADAMALADELGLGGLVHFPGRLPDAEVAALLATAAVGLAPDPPGPLNDVSTMNKILEYMAMECPTAAFDLAEARVSAGPAGAYADPGDPDDLARVVGDLLDDPARRAEMGALGRARVTGELSWAVSEKNLLAAYARATEVAR